MFKHTVIVYYARVQSRDSVAVAVSTIGSGLSETLIDAKAAEKALKDKPTLVILDNLEALADEPLKDLLDAAVQWSRLAVRGSFAPLAGQTSATRSIRWKARWNIAASAWPDWEVSKLQGTLWNGTHI